jgi:DNA recombination protein RmuC
MESPLSVIALVIAVLATVAAVVFLLRAGASRREADRLRGELGTATAELRLRESERAGHLAELAVLREQRQQSAAEASGLASSLQERTQRLAETEASLRDERAQRADTERLASATSNDLAAARENLRLLTQQLDEQRRWVEAETRHFEERVVATAARLMEERSRAYAEANRKEVGDVIAPFKQQLDEFRQRVDHIYAADSQERSFLKAQIDQLTSVNQAVSVQADRLVNALTVTSKSVGDWGETILEKILEDSALRRGHDYDLQFAVRGADGERLIPDAVIHLPEGRQLVVDSKVSNKAWTDYCSEGDDTRREQLMQQHLLSLRAHLKNLSGKRYAESPDLRTVDFVLMFVPVEAALLTAFTKDATLYADAYRQRIVMVTPSTLMAVIKLVEGIWTFQKRKESADEIAEAGRKLYDKLANYAESFLDVGRAIDQSQKAFKKARDQLSEGRGNALGLAEKLKDLGVTPSAGKQIPAALLGSSSPDEGEGG